MNAPSTELHRKTRQNAAETGQPEAKNLESIKGRLEPSNPLKSHKTAKAFFGKAWSKTREFWRSLEEGLEGAFIPPPSAPPTSGLKSSWIVIARGEAAKQPRGGFRTEKEKKRGVSVAGIAAREDRTAKRESPGNGAAKA